MNYQEHLRKFFNFISDIVFPPLLQFSCLPATSILHISNRYLFQIQFFLYKPLTLWQWDFSALNRFPILIKYPNLMSVLASDKFKHPKIGWTNSKFLVGDQIQGSRKISCFISLIIFISHTKHWNWQNCMSQ